jgi:L-glutamine-phosphate cytidylyltransferase
MNQTLTRKQFDILSILAEEKGTLSQRQLGEKSGHSLGTVNRVMQELTELQYVTEGDYIKRGRVERQPYRSDQSGSYF